jgi:hypothetical protein
MALYVKFYEDDHNEVVFHVGSGKLPSRLPQHAIFYEVQADGDELEKIREQFTNIRMTTNRVVFWKDEDAQFIVDNLKL